MSTSVNADREVIRPSLRSLAGAVGCLGMIMIVVVVIGAALGVGGTGWGRPARAAISVLAAVALGLLCLFRTCSRVVLDTEALTYRGPAGFRSAPRSNIRTVIWHQPGDPSIRYALFLDDGGRCIVSLAIPYWAEKDARRLARTLEVASAAGGFAPRSSVALRKAVSTGLPFYLARPKAFAVAWVGGLAVVSVGTAVVIVGR